MMKSGEGGADRRRRWQLALGVYIVCTAIFLGTAPPKHWRTHTEFNHYALLADSWLRGRLDLGHAPPAYTQNNDFALRDGRWYVSFPPFPAVVILPAVKFAGSPERLPDGIFWTFLAGLGPAMLFLALEKLRRRGYAQGTERRNLLLAGLFAFGSVYYFCAIQGTVWFSAHVVSVALIGLFFLAALDADRPFVAGLCIILAFATRGPPIALGALFFVWEALRRSLREAPFRFHWSVLRSIDYRYLVRTFPWFALPMVLVGAAVLWHNQARFGTVLEFGHSHLTVGWQGRIQKWGLFSYHFLARNLGVMLTSLPYVTRNWPYVQINTHGLALWLTSPFYLWLLWPRRVTPLWYGLVVTVAAVAGYDLLYQNSGWLQFGYRFSNDYAVYLFAMLALGGFRFGRLFWTAALFAIAVNTFGAITFQRATYFYYSDQTQQILYQPD